MQTPLVCVSCGDEIVDRDSALTTPHGTYHGAPFTCVEGRKDDDIPWYQK